MSTLVLPRPYAYRWMPLDLNEFFEKANISPQECEAYVREQVQKMMRKRWNYHMRAQKGACARWNIHRFPPSIEDARAYAASIGKHLENGYENTIRWIANSQKRRAHASRAANARWHKIEHPVSIGEAAAGSRKSSTTIKRVLKVLNPLTPFQRNNPFQKFPNIDRRDSADDLEAGNILATPSESVAEEQTSFWGRFKTAPVPRNEDSRIEQFRNAVKDFWRRNNPDNPECPWIRKDQKALEEFLEGSPNITLEKFNEWLHYRGRSEINYTDLPRRWLANLAEFADGPLDRFRKRLGCGSKTNAASNFDGLGDSYMRANPHLYK